MINHKNFNVQVEENSTEVVVGHIDFPGMSARFATPGVMVSATQNPTDSVETAALRALATAGVHAVIEEVLGRHALDDEYAVAAEEIAGILTTQYQAAPAPLEGNE